MPAAPGMDECGGTTRLCVKECPKETTFIAADPIRALGKVEYERPIHFQRYELVPSWNFQRYDHLKSQILVKEVSWNIFLMRRPRGRNFIYRNL